MKTALRAVQCDTDFRTESAIPKTQPAPITIVNAIPAGVKCPLRMLLTPSRNSQIATMIGSQKRYILLGAGVGIAAALAAGHILQRLVEGMRPAEPFTFAVTIPALVIAALFASFVPARRASRVDPMRTLRQE